MQPFNSLRSGLSCAAVLVLAVLAPTISASPKTDVGVHGIGLSAGLDEPFCEGEMITGTMTASHFDGLGDTSEVVDAFAIIEAAGGNVRIPAAGNLEIVSITGNAFAAKASWSMISPTTQWHSSRRIDGDPSFATWRTTRRIRR